MSGRLEQTKMCSASSPSSEEVEHVSPHYLPSCTLTRGKPIIKKAKDSLRRLEGMQFAVAERGPSLHS